MHRMIIYAVNILKNPEAMKAKAENGFKNFSEHSYIEILDSVIGVAPQNKIYPSYIPKILNAGSGKNFIPTALNIDCNPKWHPDLVLDLSKSITYSGYETGRFGKIELKPNMFEVIIADQLLEHVSDLILTMTNFLNLLCEGGELHASVPYDLSCGAWQDPTHVRAFNEKSWLYYTEWSWYIGWREERFDLVNLEFDYSEIGKKMINKRIDKELILQTPRAVNEMKVCLRKRKTNDREKILHDKLTRSIYASPQNPWSANMYIF